MTPGVRSTAIVARVALLLRAELCERAFAHVLDRGGMRRTWLRGRDNVAKRYPIHVAGSNLGLLMRTLFGAGTPRAAAEIRLFWLIVDDHVLLVLLAPTVPGSSPARLVRCHHGHRSVEDQGRDHAALPEPRHEGRGPPVAMRHGGDQALTERAAAVAPGPCWWRCRSRRQRRRAGSMKRCQTHHRRRWPATSGRSCSAALKGFFYA